MPVSAQHWSRLSDEKLLQLRFCDLGLGAPHRPRLRRAIERLYAELAGRGIRLRPHLWLADEWFSPDGIPGIAIPFYLAHPRLERLERRMTRQVEGGDDASLMRILRHEAGHAVDTAWRLRRRKCFRETFGPASQRYPSTYHARPGSRRYVQHLDEWYAQSHPTEDFAETFAVWLQPRSAWRSRYAGWPALGKLELVAGLMQELRDQAPRVRCRAHIEPIDRNRQTLAEHYRRKLAHRARRRPASLDTVLCRVFAADPPRPRAPRAAALLRAQRPGLLASLLREPGMDRYSAGQLLDMAVDRCDAMVLHLRGDRHTGLREARAGLTRLARTYLRWRSPLLRL